MSLPSKTFAEGGRKGFIDLGGGCLVPERRAVGGILLFFAASLLSPPVARAQPAPNPKDLLEQLNGVSIDPGQIYVLQDVHIIRDRVNIYFTRGFIGFFTRVAGEVTGATFTGEGEVLLMPPDSAERQSLAQFTRSPVLEERFTSAYLRFSDQTAREVQAMARKPDPEDLEQPTGFLEEWNRVVRRLAPEDSVRVLEDLLGDRRFPYFQVRVEGVNLGVFQVTVDERSSEAVVAGSARQSQGKLFDDIWCSFPSQAARGRAPSADHAAVRVISYHIETQIDEDQSLRGRAEVTLESRSSHDRVLGFELSRRLKVADVLDEQGQGLFFLQNPSLEESESAARGNDWVVVVLPAAHEVGEKFRLRFTYVGNVIADVGNGVLYVGARGSWYPNRGMGERAIYDLTFDCPERLTLVATGSRVEETTANGRRRSRWVSNGQFPVAGFNLGAYEHRERQVGATTIEVYATREAEAALERRHAAAAAAQAAADQLTVQGRFKAHPLPSPVPPLAPIALLDAMTENAAHTIRYFETLFGPFPYPRLALAQIPGTFGQGWPELVYLPTLSFLSASERSQLVQGGSREELMDRMIPAHEIAHQWWGNRLGWKSYRDQWLSEGFSTYSAALYLTQEKGGKRLIHEMLRGYKQDLLRKTKEGHTVESGGPIWLGARLTNSLNPEGYPDVVYMKACWTLHMLRWLMTDPATGSDERFFLMLRDFVAAYHDTAPSTEDFIHHAEKYTPPAANLERNGRLDWFFSEWVYNTGVPTYKVSSTVRRLRSGKFAVEGGIEQDGVSSTFEMLVPLLAVYARDRKATLGGVVVTEAGGKFRFLATERPARVAIDEDRILAVIR